MNSNRQIYDNYIIGKWGNVEIKDGIDKSEPIRAGQLSALEMFYQKHPTPVYELVDVVAYHRSDKEFDYERRRGLKRYEANWILSTLHKFKDSKTRKKGQKTKSKSSTEKSVRLHFPTEMIIYEVYLESGCMEVSWSTNNQNDWKIMLDIIRNIDNSKFIPSRKVWKIPKKSISKYLRIKDVIKKHEESPVSPVTAKKEQNSNTTINYYEYIESDEWKEKSRLAKERVGNRCQLCNRPSNEVELNTHHRTYERLGHEDDNDLTVLCKDCHYLFESSSKHRPTKSKFKEK